MSDTDRTEAQLIGDLDTLGERFTDEGFSTELYRALAGGRLTKDGATVAVSWNRAEAIVNGLRENGDRAPLTLAQTGGEGELSDLVADELRGLGWKWEPRDPGRNDPAHSGQPDSPPPADAGERQAPVSPSGDWERQAHDEAEAARRGSADAPPAALPGTAAGGGDPGRAGGS